MMRRPTRLLNPAFRAMDELRALQRHKLKALLQHAYNTCEFYHTRFEELGLCPADFHSPIDLQKLPLLTKRDIQLNAQQMLTTDARVTGIVQNSTGGSTGQPLNFYQDDNYRRWADVARHRAWRQHPSVPPWGIEAVLWGADRDVGRGLSYRKIAKNLIRYRTLQLNTFDLDVRTIQRYFRIYNLVRPHILRGYASSLYFVAQTLEELGLRVHTPQVILSSAEMLWPAMREKISQVFGADILDSYGCREVSQIATECPKHCGLHVVMENQYVEIVDGQIVVTNLNNLAMPFIRYVVGDMAESITSEPCACGRQSERLLGLKGRDNDNITLPGGRVVNGEFFEFLFFGFHTVERFQVIYSRADERLRVRLKVSDHSENISEMIEQRMEESFQFGNVEIEFTDDFDRSPTGKFRFVYSVDSFDEVPSLAT